MATLFFLKESLQTTNIAIGELAALLDNEGIVAPMETTENFSIIVKQDISFDILERIVEKAGYVHSAGPLIFNELWNNISHIEISYYILKYFNKNKIHLQISTFEKPKDSKTAELWKKRNSSILEAQIRTDKAFLGRMSFNKLLDQTSQTLRSAAFNKDIPLYQNKKGALFIYCDYYKDKQKSTILEYPGWNIDTHLICYHSVVRNIDPVLCFKEKKPYWAGIFTTPQSLMTAMVNLSMPTPDKILFEPFTHTASVPLQAARCGMTFTAVDIENISGGEDNVNFFTLNDNEFVQLLKKIENICTAKSQTHDLKNNYYEILQKLNKAAQEAVKKPESDYQ